MNSQHNQENIKLLVLKNLGDIRQPNDFTLARNDFLLNPYESEFSSLLPDGDLIYILFINFLEFKNLGRSEKISWSIPIDYQGKLFLLELRKSGLGLFMQDEIDDEKRSKEIICHINKAIKSYKPFLKDIKKNIFNTHEIILNNNFCNLFERYEYFQKSFKKIIKEYVLEHRKNKEDVILSLSLYLRPECREAQHIAIAMIYAFFDLTEHLFVLIYAISSKENIDGKEILRILKKNWKEKYIKIFNVEQNKEEKTFFDKLVLIRKELRNFIIHGSFGKNGEEFSFASSIGSVPMSLGCAKNSIRITDSAFNIISVAKTLEQFINFLQSGKYQLAYLYVQSELPVSLKMHADGTYSNALQAFDNMKNLIDKMYYLREMHNNMDY